MQYTIADAAEMVGLSVRRTQHLALAMGLGLRIMGGTKVVAYLLEDSDIEAIRNRNAITQEETSQS